MKLKLTIEPSGGKLWGRVTYNDNLITDFADSLPELEDKMKTLLFDFEQVSPDTVRFEHIYE